MTSVGSYLHTSYIIISHNISFNCSLHVPNCSCYQSRPYKYRLLKSIRHRLIYHYSFVLSLLFSRYILIVSGWPHSFFDWPCASLSLVSNCVPVHEIIVRCLSPVWRLSFLYIGVILACRSLLLFCLVLFSVLFFLFLCFSFLTKFENPNEGNQCTGCWLQLAHPSFKTE